MDYELIWADIENGLLHGRDPVEMLRTYFPEPAPAEQGDGSEANPFTHTFSGKGFKRHDSPLFIGVCERDDGFEVLVTPENGKQRLYVILPDGSLIGDSAPAEQGEKPDEADVFIAPKIIGHLVGKLHFVPLAARPQPESAKDADDRFLMLAEHIYEMAAQGEEKDQWLHKFDAKAAALIQSTFERWKDQALRDAAERAVAFYDLGFAPGQADELRAAILGIKKEKQG